MNHGNNNYTIKDIRFALLNKLPYEYGLKLLEWRNQKFVRDKMFNDKVIALNEHIEYIKKHGNNILIGFNNEKPFCVINFIYYDVSGIELGYYLIDNELIGSGFGAIMEFFSLCYIFEVEKKIPCVFCRTLESNSSVVNLHKRFGYSFVGKGITNSKTYILQRICNKDWIKAKPSVEKLIKKIMKVDDFDCLDMFIV